MESLLNTRLILTFSLTTITFAVLVPQPVAAQRAIESLTELKEEQAERRVDRELAAAQKQIEQAQQQANAATSRANRAKRNKKGGNIQIRRGDTSGLDQDQVGEGNSQSASVGSD